MSDKPFKWSDVKSLVSVWLLAIAISCVSLITSVAIVVSERVTYTCKDNGHSYSARYEEQINKQVFKAVVEKLEDDVHPQYVNSAMNYATTKVYLSDICEYCGDAVIFSREALTEPIKLVGTAVEDSQ